MNAASERPPIEGTQIDNARLAGELAFLRAQVAQINAQARITATSAAHATEPQSQSEAEMTQTEVAEQRRQDEDRRRAYLDRIQDDFRKESIDPKWSARSQNAIQSVLDSKEIHLPAQALECRSSMCRVELSEDGPNAEELVERVTTQLGTTLPRAVVDHVEDGAGRKKAILYLSQTSG